MNVLEKKLDHTKKFIEENLCYLTTLRMELKQKQGGDPFQKAILEAKLQGACNMLENLTMIIEEDL